VRIGTRDNAAFGDSCSSSKRSTRMGTKQENDRRGTRGAQWGLERCLSEQNVLHQATSIKVPEATHTHGKGKEGRAKTYRAAQGTEQRGARGSLTQRNGGIYRKRAGTCDPRVRREK